jgi:secreted PhoX family phosphatase
VTEGSSERGMTRRTALRVGMGAAGGAALTGGMLGRALESMAAPAVAGAGPYGPLQAPDANGVRLPKGFTSRVIASVGDPVLPGGEPFHLLPDGMGAYKTDDGGFILVSNCEAPYVPNFWEVGTAAIRFDRNFNVTDYYPILKGTHVNCAGGVTPWGTWLSCEEVERTGAVWECDPWGVKPAVAHRAMGLFKHEACVIDPVGRKAYLTEDLGDGCFYRFSPDAYPDLSKGTLEAAAVQDDGTVKWLRVNDPQQTAGIPTRDQVPAATRFRRGEGMWYDEGVVYFATTQDDRVYAYHCASEELEVLYDGVALGEDAPLHDTDNVTVARISGDLYVCEDAGDQQVCIISAEGEAAPFAELPGPEHDSSELTGPVFDPTGSRFYFASQRSAPGRIYEISGPFRRLRAEPVDPPPDPVDPPKPRDRKKPSVKIRTLGKPSLRRLLRSGQPFRIKVADDSPPVELEVKLVTKLRRKAGKGSRQVTIGGMTTKAGRNADRKIRVRVRPRFKQRLRRRDVARARLVVIATDQAGNRTKATKRVRFS